MRIVAAGLLGIVFVSTALAQSACGHAFQTGLDHVGASSYVQCSTVWYPGGTGPAQLVVGGVFGSLGGVPVRGIASRDLATGAWSALGAGLTGTPVVVTALKTLPSGALLVGGTFALAGGPPNGGVVQWDGSQWTTLGTDLSGSVNDLAQLPNGDIAAAGQLYVGPLMQRSPIAIWNGSQWSVPGGGVTPDYVVARMTQLPTGDLLLVGQFTAPFAGRALWNGSAWTPPPTLGNGFVDQVLTAPNGDLVITGTFTSVFGVPADGLVRWNGQTWSGFGNLGLTGSSLAALAFLPNGELVAGGAFAQIGGVAASCVARWDGAAWQPFSTGLGDPQQVFGSAPIARTLAVLPNGNLFVGGTFSGAGAVMTRCLAVWDGVEWGAVTGGSNGAILALRTLRSGDVLAAGDFTVLGDGAARGVARWNGATWQPLGAGLRRTGAVAEVADAIELANGDVLVVGAFTTAGNVPAANVARWNGNTWSALGSGLTGGSGFGTSAPCAAELPNGDVVVGGWFGTAGGQTVNGIARWNGSSWAPMGSGLGSGFQPKVSVAIVMPNGDLIVAGSFQSFGGVAARNIVRWNGSAWSPLGNGLGTGFFDEVTDVSLRATGELLAVGSFTTASGVPANGAALWNGSTWSAFSPALPSASATAIGTAPNGDLLLAGAFPSGSDLHGLLRCDGSTWSFVDARIGPSSFPAATALAVATRPDGEVLLGGTFTYTQQPSGILQATPYLARLVSTCPATASAVGSGCVGSGGPNALVATSLPWLGGVCTARATGMPANGVALAVLGLGPAAVPLATILPQGGPGCLLLATPDRLDLCLPNAGVVNVSFAVPLAASLVGNPLQQQVVALELGGNGAITALTAGNALALTFGLF